MGSQILVMTGSFPPDVCGVGSYTQKLVYELECDSVEVEVFYRKDWRLRRVREYLKSITNSKPRVINLQYPTEGYGYSLVPQLLCWLTRGCKKLVTLHEFSRKSLKGKAAIYLFFLVADWVIFTTEVEQEYALKVAPWLKKRSSVVPIGSNIPLQERQTPDIDIVYFGLIRPLKGLEEFTYIISSLNGRYRYRICVIGQIVVGYENYASDIMEQLKSLGIEIMLNRSAEEVSTLLSRSRIAVLPFPDGLTSRRGSALATMGNGALVVTTPAAIGEEEIAHVCVTARTKEEFCRVILDALRQPCFYESIRQRGELYARSKSWKLIGEMYRDVIRELKTDVLKNDLYPAPNRTSQRR